jgi:4-hydroxybenzoate polyprenyltransferase
MLEVLRRTARDDSVQSHGVRDAVCPVRGSMAWTAPLPDSVHRPRSLPGWKHRISPSRSRSEHSTCVGILLCLVFARSAAMAFNRLVDRHLDSLNPRTANRHLPAGQLSVGSYAIHHPEQRRLLAEPRFLFLPESLADPSWPFPSCWSSWPTATRSDSPPWPTFGSGLSLMLAPVSAWIAIRGQWLIAKSPADLLPSIFLGGAVLSWVAGFDIIYACQDADFDREAKLHSIPACWGISAALRLSACCHFVTVPVTRHPPFGLSPARARLALSHRYSRRSGSSWLTNIGWSSPDDLTRVNVAFFQVNAVISLGLLAVGSADLFLLSGS